MIVEALKKETYNKTGRPYPLNMILRVVGCSSGNWYDRPETSSSENGTPVVRGRRPAMNDEELLSAVRKAIDDSHFIGEGSAKIWHRLKRAGQIASRARVLKVMKDNELLSPYRHNAASNRKNPHEGTIVQNAPNQLWGTDGKKFYVEAEGWCWFFGVIDHFNDELLAWNTCKKGTRYEALEPVRSAIRKQFGNVNQNVCKGMGLKLRSDHGSQYDSDAFMGEMKFLGLEMSKSYVRQPECNGCIERFNRTIEEEVFSLSHFKTLDEANEAIRKFVENYNREWLICRLGYKSPLEYRNEYKRKVA